MPKRHRTILQVHSPSEGKVHLHLPIDWPSNRNDEASQNGRLLVFHLLPQPLGEGDKRAIMQVIIKWKWNSFIPCC